MVAGFFFCLVENLYIDFYKGASDMITNEKKEHDNFYNDFLNICSVERIEETDVISLLITKEDIADREMPYVDIIKKLADKDKKMFDFGNTTSIVLDSASGLKKIIITGLGEADKLKPNILRKAAGETARTLVKADGEKTLVFAPAAISNNGSIYLSALI